MSSPTPTNLRAILAKQFWMCAPLAPDTYPDEASYNDAVGDWENTLDEAIAAVLALLPEKRQVRPKPTTIGEILQGQPYPVDQYNSGFNEAIDQTRRNLIGEQL